MASIKAKGRGKWMVRVFLGRDDETGKVQFHSRVIRGKKETAEQYARDRERERDLLGANAVRALSLGVDDLLADLLADYKINGKSYWWAEGHVRKHLRPFFGKLSAAKVTSDVINAFILKRREERASNASINRSLSLLRRAFNLAAKADPPKVAKVPRIPKLAEDNTRTGFFEDADYRALLRTLPDYLKPVLAFAYHTGCRKGEILRLQWSQVDLASGTVRLNPGETKNKQGRIIPLALELLDMLKLHWARHQADFPASPWVFTYERGLPFQDFRDSWATACKAAGLWTGDGKTGRPSRLFHDLRRSGVRNLVRSGAPEKVAQTISGHKTRAVFDRYNIVSEDDLKDAARKLDEYLKVRRAAEERLSAPSGSYTPVTPAAERLQ